MDPKTLKEEEKIKKLSAEAVLVKSDDSIVDKTNIIKGYDFNKGIDFKALLDTYKYSGFQASNLGKAIEIINKMLNWRLSDEPIAKDEDEEYLDPKVRAKTKCKIFLGFTSNMISSGMREIIKFLCQHKLVDVIVATAGGIEEDFIKCFKPTYLGAFNLPGKFLRSKGVNRIGNLLIPNDNYCEFEDWIQPILTQMLKEQEEKNVNWTPSKMIHRLGKEINNEDSVFYWCYKNNIPVYSPALTDGSIGDMLYFHSYKHPGLRLDIIEDIRGVNRQAVFAKKTGMFIIGGGLIKHHICNANLMRNGADFSVFLNTANEFDGSDSGARPDEAVSWGKIKGDKEDMVKIHGEATLLLPIIVASTFAKKHFEDLKKSKDEKEKVEKKIEK